MIACVVLFFCFYYCSINFQMFSKNILHIPFTLHDCKQKYSASLNKVTNTSIKFCTNHSKKSCDNINGYRQQYSYTKTLNNKNIYINKYI